MPNLEPVVGELCHQTLWT